MRVRPRHMRMHVCITPGHVYGSYEWMHMSPRTWQDICGLSGGARVIPAMHTWCVMMAGGIFSSTRMMIGDSPSLHVHNA